MRELLWRWEGIVYQQFMQSAFIAAAIYNAQRSKKSDKVWSWVQLHPKHAERRTSASGKQVIAQVIAMSGDGEWEFAPGHNWDTIMGT